MDKSVIEKIKETYDLTKDEDILALYAALQAGKYRLVSPEERRFDDEIYERAMEVKARRAGKDRNNRERAQHRQADQKQDAREKGQSVRRKKIVVLTRKELRMKRFVTMLLLLAAVGCLTYFGMYCYDSYLSRQTSERLSAKKENKAVSAMYEDTSVTYQDAENGTEKVLNVLDEYKSLYNQNKNLIGWLKIADTNIDYPVMQTSDNEYYLDHDINQQQDKNGTLFLDAACDVVKPSDNLIIYGHNMRSGNMFGNLDLYKDPAFYRKHTTIQFDSIYEKGTYEVMYVFNSHIYAEDEIAFKYYQMIDIASEKEFESDMNAMREMSFYDTGVTAGYGDRLLTLSTCDYGEEDGRFVVVAKRIQ